MCLQGLPGVVNPTAGCVMTGQQCLSAGPQMNRAAVVGVRGSREECTDRLPLVVSPQQCGSAETRQPCCNITPGTVKTGLAGCQGGGGVLQRGGGGHLVHLVPSRSALPGSGTGPSAAVPRLSARCGGHSAVAGLV
ncbi:unnamed protein product [Gadus morhua 'NCC']